jgi:Protein of unknown function (DUF4232)
VRVAWLSDDRLPRFAWPHDPVPLHPPRRHGRGGQVTANGPARPTRNSVLRPQQVPLRRARDGRRQVALRASAWRARCPAAPDEALPDHRLLPDRWPIHHHCRIADRRPVDPSRSATSVNAVAPPESPPVDELEGLIREARDRQRRRSILVAVGVSALAGAVIVAYALANATLRGNSHSLAAASRPAGGVRCRADQLAISFVDRGAAVMGEEGGLLRFTNIGRSVCNIRGWPRVVAIRRGGSRVAALRIADAPMLFATYWLHGPRVPTLALRRQASGYAILGGFDNPVGRPPRWRCPSARRLVVTPPGSRRLVSLSGLLWAARGDRVYLPLCGGKPFVSTIRARPPLLHIPSS